MIRKPGQEWRLATPDDYRAPMIEEPEAPPTPKPIEWPKRATEPPPPPKAKLKPKAKAKTPRRTSGVAAGAKAARAPRKPKAAPVKSE
jgi:hypothetical protein